MTVACQECVPLMPNGGRIIGVTYAPGSRTGSWQVWIAMGGGKAAMESTIRYFAVALARKGHSSAPRRRALSPARPSTSMAAHR
jgi:enoyl-[acyl-carrier-protein] reductase (NADH)